MTKRPHLVLFLTLAALTWSCTAGDGNAPLGTDRSALDDSARAHEMVENALTHLGGAGAIGRAGGLTVEGVGSFDLGTRLQGSRPDASEPVPLRESLAIDPQGDRIVYEYRHRTNLDADEEWLRSVFIGPETMEGYVPDLEIAWAEKHRGVSGNRRRHERMAPHLLLEAVLASPGSLRTSVERADGRKSVHAVLAGGEPITLLFDGGGRRLEGFEFLLDMPLLGDAPVRWELMAEEEVPNLGRYPSGYHILLDGKLLKKVEFTTIRAGAPPEELFSLPEGVEKPVPPDSEPDLGPGAGARPSALQVSPGVHLITNVRGGFHVLAVEREDHLVVVDAPSGWWEIHLVPPRDFTHEVSSHGVSERLIRVLNEAFPGKPVRYLVLTHFHSDHAGGVRAFMARGASVVGAAVTLDLVRQSLDRPFTLNPDPMDGADLEPAFVEVSGRKSLEDEVTEIELLEVEGNPHAEGLLVVHLPRQDLLYQSDLFFPPPPGRPLDSSRMAVMRFFVEWLDRQGLTPASLLAIHGTGRVTEEHLEMVRGQGPEGP